MSVRLPAVLSVALLPAILLAGCHGPPVGDAPSATFVASEYQFEGPDSLNAGWNRITLDNDGAEIHHMIVYRLDDGVTPEEFFAAFSQSGPGEGAGATSVGGPNAVAPGAAETAWVKLAPGTHIVMCVVPDAEGKPHVLHGMQRVLQVNPGGDGVEAPESHASVDLHDFNFGTGDTMEAGTHTVRVENKGAQDHEATLIRLEEGATAMDFVAGFGPDAQGPPPGQAAGGYTNLAPGDVAYFQARLEPGTYAYICFLTDPADGQEHFLKGMTREFTVS